jgi:outer membrane protein TolC
MPADIGALIAEALAANPQIRAARHAQDAAERHAASAGSLEDPTLELGVVNEPLPLSLRRDDMTMKMLGLAQKLPYPGKRALRESVAAADAASVGLAVEETANRVVRDLRVAYEDLRLATAAERIATQSRELLRELVAVSTAQYALGRAAQSDVLRAQAEVGRMQAELLGNAAQQASRQGDLARLLGRDEAAAPIVPAAPALLPLQGPPEALAVAAREQRPELRALDALVEKGEREVELARREYYPDFELRFAYGQRDRTIGGTPRDDMITLTVAVSLPIWRQSRLSPRVAEARALREQAAALVDAQRLEGRTGLAQQLAVERSTRDSATLYRSTLVPQAHAAADSALHAYQLGRVDFLTVLDARLREHATALAEAEAIASHNKAVAEIDFLTGAAPQPVPHSGAQP